MWCKTTSFLSGFYNEPLLLGEPTKIPWDLENVGVGVVANCYCFKGFDQDFRPSTCSFFSLSAFSSGPHSAVTQELHLDDGP